MDNYVSSRNLILYSLYIYIYLENIFSGFVPYLTSYRGVKKTMGGTFPAILCQVWNFDNKALICLIPNFAQLSAVFAVCRTVFLGQFKRLTLCVSNADALVRSVS